MIRVNCQNFIYKQGNPPKPPRIIKATMSKINTAVQDYQNIRGQIKNRILIAFSLVLWFFICTGSILFLGAPMIGLFFMVALFLLVLILMINRFGIRSILYSFLVILPIQPFLTMPISYKLTNFDIKIFVALKEILLLLLFSIIFKNFTKLKFVIADYAAFFYLSVYLFGLFKTGIGFSQIVSFREGAILVLLYFTGRMLYLSKISALEIVTVAFYISIPLVIFGYIERFILGDWFWDMWGALNYLRTKFSTGVLFIKSANGIPSNWYTFIGEGSFRRIVSTIGDAPSFSRYLSFSVVAFLYYKSLRKNAVSYCIFIASSICLILTFGRGGMLISIGALIPLILYSKIRYKYISILPITIVFIIMVLKMNMFDLNSAVGQRHTTGLIDGIKTIFDSYTGHGLGTSGQLSMLYSQNIEENIQESYIGGLSYQLGLLGVTSYIIWIFSLLIYLLKKHIAINKFQPDKAKQFLFSLSLLTGVFLTSFLANNAISPISAGTVFLVLGVSVSELVFEYEDKQ